MGIVHTPMVHRNALQQGCALCRQVLNTTSACVQQWWRQRDGAHSIAPLTCACLLHPNLCSRPNNQRNTDQPFHIGLHDRRHHLALRLHHDLSQPRSLSHLVCPFLCLYQKPLEVTQCSQ